MKIWVDADACPAVIKDIVYKAAVRRQLMVTLVANSAFRIPKSPFIAFLRVPAGPDEADNAIVDRLEAGDLVISGDIPLAARVVEKGGLALNPRGEVYSEENIAERLSTRDFLDTLRSSGVETGGPPALSKRDRQLFANSLDRIVSRK